MKIKIGDTEKEIILSVETLSIYEEEFNRDLIQDFFGKVDVRRGDLKDIAEEAVGDGEKEDEEVSEPSDDDLLFTIDYTSTNWTSITRVLWAALRTADRSTPSYLSWIKTLGAINLNTINAQITPECMRQFFRKEEG